MRIMTQASALALALVAAPAFAQDTQIDTDVVDPSSAITAVSHIKAAQDRIDSQMDQEAAITATSRIKAGRDRYEDRMNRRAEMMDLFRQIDTDGDGRLTEQEIRDGAADILNVLDRNGDGALSEEDMIHHRGKGGQMNGVDDITDEQVIDPSASVPEEDAPDIN